MPRRDLRSQFRVLVLVLLALGSWAWPTRAWAAGPAWAVESVVVPAEVAAGEALVVSIRIRNVGDEPFAPGAGDRLSYRLRGGDGRSLGEGRRTLLPTRVAPGESVSLAARVQIPTALVDGETLELEWGMLREDARWYPPPSTGRSPIVSLRVGTRAVHWTLLGVRAPDSDAGAGRYRGSSGATVVVPIDVRNDGPWPWSPAKADRFSYRIYDGDGRMLVREGARSELPHDVPVGRSATVDLRVELPDARATVWVEVEPVRDGVRWYGAGADASLIGIDVDAPGLRWRLEDEQIPSTVRATDQLQFAVTVTNVGDEPWLEGDALTYAWLDEHGRRIGEGPRSPFDDIVLPGETVTVAMRLLVPAEPGLRWLDLQPVREGVRWYGRPVDGDPPRPIRIIPPGLRWSLLGVSTPTSMWTGHEHRVRVSMRNEGVVPWSDRDGDRLSYRYVDSKGEVVSEGRRTMLGRDVAPGETISVDAVVIGPRVPGDVTLRWEMVREHVRWYGEPVVGKADASVRVAVRSPARWARLACLAFAPALVVIVRRRRRWGRYAWAAAELGVVAWAIASASTLSSTFAELAHLRLFAGAPALIVSASAVMALPVALARGRARWRWAAFVLIVGGALAWVDLVYMHFFGSIVTVSALGSAVHVFDVAASGASRFEFAHLGFVWPGVLAFGLSFAWPPRPSRPHWSWRAGPASICAIVMVPALAQLARDVRVPSRRDLVFSEQRSVQRTGLWNAHALDVLRAWNRPRRAESLEGPQRRRVERFYGERARAAAETDALASFGRARGMNVAVIQVEALQQWVIGATVAGQEVTPFMNSLSTRGWAYTRIFDQTAAGKTSDAEFAVLASNHPLRQGALAFLRADGEFVTLAHALKELGYTTVSAHPFDRGFWNRAVMHPRYGFDRSLFRRELGAGPRIGWGLSDRAFLGRVAQRSLAWPEPWFAFLVTLSLHHPYSDFPAGLAELELGSLAGTALGNYLQAMRHFDGALANLVQSLDLSRTMVVVYGDHDARLGWREHPQILELAGRPAWTPGIEGLSDRVPVFIVAPGLVGEIRQTGGQVDIAPTVLHLLGVRRPASFVGHALVPGAPERIAAQAGGSAHDDRRGLVVGSSLPEGGGCFSSTSSRSRPRGECDGLERRARAELEASRAALDADWFRRLASGSAAP